MRTPEQPDIFRPEQLHFDEVVGSFDFDELDNSVNDLARDVGYYDTPPRSLRSGSFHEGTADQKGVYDPGSKRIGLGIRKIEQDALVADIDSEKLAEHVIIHEEVHAISGQHCFDILRKDIFDINRFEKDAQIGFDRTKGSSRVYRLWNEGVTEKLARETYRKYALAKHSATEEEINIYMAKVKEYGHKTNEFYQPEVDLVDGFIERVAKGVGIDSTLVWKAIKQGLVRGEEWHATEFAELARDILPSNFMDDVERLSTHRTAQRLIQELSRVKAKGVIRSSKIVRKIKRVIEKIRL